MSAVLALALAAAKPKPKPPAPPVAVEAKVEKLADGWRADVTLDRPIAGWALPKDRDGHRALFLLTAPARKSKADAAAAPCGPKEVDEGAGRVAQLYRWSFASPERLELLGSNLPDGSLDAADLDGDGVDELVLTHNGGIDRISIESGGAPTITTLVADAAIGKPCCGPRIASDRAAAGDVRLRVPVLGGFRTYAQNGSGALALASESTTPVRADAGPELFRVKSPAVSTVGRAASGRIVFATEPEALGKRRLRTLLIDPDGPAETRVTESWAMFPEAERVVDRDFAILRGAPVLVVATTSGEKLSLLGEKALRIFPLGGDRTRAGDAPMFAATTGINLWQAVRPSIVDLDRDGNDDLVLGYWKGLKNAIVAFEIYRGTAAGSFGKSRTMSFDVEQGQKGFFEFGADLDGDARPDLAVLAGGKLLVYPGTAPDRAIDHPVDKSPSRTIPLVPGFPGPGDTELDLDLGGVAINRRAGGLGTPHLIDLDGDGRPEAVFAGDDDNGHGRATIVFVRGSR